MTHWSGDLPKAEDILDERNTHHYQVILKSHNFAPSAENPSKPGDTYLSNSLMEQNHYSKVSLHPAQLHPQPRLSEQYLAATFLDGKEAIDKEDKEDLIFPWNHSLIWLQIRLPRMMTLLIFPQKLFGSRLEKKISLHHQY